MNKKIIIGVGLVAVCLIIGLSQMRGGYCTISLPSDGNQPEAEPLKVISLSEVQKTKEQEKKREVPKTAEFVAAEAERAFTEKEAAAAAAIEEKSLETEPSLSVIDGDLARTGDGVAPLGNDTPEAEQKMSQDQFLILCASGSSQMIKEAIENGLDVNAIGLQMKITPLMAAISDKDARSSLAKVKLLIKAGARPSVLASDDEKEGPLHLAARISDSVGLVDYLIASGADVNARDARGFSPLITAAAPTGNLSPQDQIETLKALINAGADLNQTTNNGATALSLAAINSSPKVLQLLIENGAKVNVADKQGRTALMVAVWGNSPDAVRTLLDNGADPNLKDKDGQGVLDHAGRHNNPAADQIRKILNMVLNR